MNTIDKNDDFWLKPKLVQGMFFVLIILGGMLTYLDNWVSDQLSKVTLSIFSIVMIGLAFATLNKGSSVKTEDRIRRIESKLDKILEHRDDVIQNK